MTFDLHGGLDGRGVQWKKRLADDPRVDPCIYELSQIRDKHWYEGLVSDYRFFATKCTSVRSIKRVLGRGGRMEYKTCSDALRLATLLL